MIDGIPPRIRAMLKQCNRKGGACNCGLTCNAEKELVSLGDSLRRKLAEVESMHAWLNRKPCTVKPDWKKPEPPEGVYQLSVYNDGGEWCPHWYSETEREDYVEITGDAAWPFIEEIAYAEDWERIGFVVI